MVAPHSEQAGTYKRTSFQYKVIHIPQGDSYRTAAPQDGPAGGTYKDASRSTTYRCFAVGGKSTLVPGRIEICPGWDNMVG
jgi:hypothetical protein